MMKDVPKEERTARFVCSICYIDEKGENKIFEGICEGKISQELRGENGFDYDRIFLYGDKTFAEMSSEEKDKVSHRRKAINQLIQFLK